MNAYSRLYTALDDMSEELRCGKCGVCENDLIYLLPKEVDRFKKLGAGIVEMDDVHYLAKHPNGSQMCPFRDHFSRQCAIYDIRPACCRMFPLEIDASRPMLWWVLCLYCPSIICDSRFRTNILSHIPKIEECFTADLLNFFAHEDLVTTRMEIMLGFPAKVAFVRPVVLGGSPIPSSNYWGLPTDRKVHLNID